MELYDEKAFERAALAGDWPGVVEALSLQSYPEPKDWSWVNEDGMSELHLHKLYVRGVRLLEWAAGNPNVPVDITRLLIVKAFGQASLLCDWETGHTALHHAIIRRREQVVAMMADEGFVKGLVMSGTGHHLLSLAAKTGRLAILKRIFFWTHRMERSIGKGTDPLWQAVSSGHVRITKFLLKFQGADPIFCVDQWRARIRDHGVIYSDDDECFKLIQAVRSVAGALMLAVRAGDLAKVRLLLKEGYFAPNGWALLNATYLEGRKTPLVLAASRGDLPMVQLLLEHVLKMEEDGGGVKVIGPDRAVLSALDVAVRGGHEELVAMLLDKAKELPSAYRSTMFTAASTGSVGILRWLLTRSPELAAESAEDALSAAVQKGHAGSVELLLRSCASKDIERWLQLGTGLSLQLLVKACWRPGRHLQALRLVLPLLPPEHYSWLRPKLWRLMACKACEAGDAVVLPWIMDKALVTQEWVGGALLPSLLSHSPDAAKFGAIQAMLLKGVKCEAIEPMWVMDPSTGPCLLRLLLEGCMEASTGRLLQWASAKGRLDLVSPVLTWGCGFGDADLHVAVVEAARCGRDGVVARLLDHGVMTSPFNSHERREASKALLAACKGGSDALVRRLVTWGGADVNYRDAGGGTAIALLVERGDMYKARLLLEAGVDFQAYVSPTLAGEVPGSASGPCAVDAYVRGVRDDLYGVLAEAEAADVVGEALKRLEGPDGPRVVNGLGGDKGWTPLMAAASKGHMQVARYLVDRGAKVNVWTATGRTALHYASAAGRVEMVQLLLAHAAQAVRDLKYVCMHGSLKTVTETLDRVEVSVDMPLFLSAVAHGHVTVVRKLLWEDSIHQLEEQAFWPPLRTAAARGRGKMVSTLLDRAPSLLQHQDEWGDTLLLTAVRWDQVEVARGLLKRGVDMGRRDREGKGAVLLACELGRLKLLSTLLASSTADLDARHGTEGLTPLVAACLGGGEARIEVVKLLLDRGADVNLMSSRARTAVMVACDRGEEELVSLLLERGADVSLMTSEGPEGRDALGMACSRQHLGLVKLIMGHGATLRCLPPPASGTSEPWRPTPSFKDLSKGLCAAARAGDLDLLRGLLGCLVAGAHGLTPRCLADAVTLAFFAACPKGHVEVVRVLLGHGAGQYRDQPHFGMKGGPSALMVACVAKQPEVVELLLPTADYAHLAYCYGETRGTALLMAAQVGSVSCVRALLRRLSELEPKGMPAQPVVDARDRHGRTALWLALWEGHADVVEVLMAYGANYTIPMHSFSFNDPQPTLRACKKEYEQMRRDMAPDMDEFEDAEDLWKAKLKAWDERKQADPFTSWWHVTPKGMAQARKSYACIWAMKTSINAASELVDLCGVNDGGEALTKRLQAYATGPLQLDLVNAMAAREARYLLVEVVNLEDLAMVERLLNRGARPNVESCDGDTPLALAVMQGAATMVSMLLSYGADPRMKHGGGKTPLMLAAKRGYLEVVLMLLQHQQARRTVEERDSLGRTALWLACRRGHTDVALELLMQGGARRQVYDKSGVTPLEAAMRSGVLDCIYLMERAAQTGLYHLHKSRVVYDASGAGVRTPPLFAGRVATGRPLPQLEISGHATAAACELQAGATTASSHRGGKRARGAEQAEEGTALFVAVARYVVTELKSDLYVELDTLIMPHKSAWKRWNRVHFIPDAENDDPHEHDEHLVGGGDEEVDQDDFVDDDVYDDDSESGSSDDDDD